MDEMNMNNALDAIHDEALKLLPYADSEMMSRGLQLIHGLAYRKHDIRILARKGKGRS